MLSGAQRSFGAGTDNTTVNANLTEVATSIFFCLDTDGLADGHAGNHRLESSPSHSH